MLHFSSTVSLVQYSALGEDYLWNTLWFLCWCVLLSWLVLCCTPFCIMRKQPTYQLSANQFCGFECLSIDVEERVYVVWILFGLHYSLHVFVFYFFFFLFLSLRGKICLACNLRWLNLNQYVQWLLDRELGQCHDICTKLMYYLCFVTSNPYSRVICSCSVLLVFQNCLQLAVKTTWSSDCSYYSPVRDRVRPLAVYKIRELSVLASYLQPVSAEPGCGNCSLFGLKS